MVNSYKDLLVWQRSMDLVEAIYRITANLPASEQFGWVAQMRRSAGRYPRMSPKDTAVKRLANIVTIFPLVAAGC